MKLTADERKVLLMLSKGETLNRKQIDNNDAVQSLLDKHLIVRVPVQRYKLNTELMDRLIKRDNEIKKQAAIEAAREEHKQRIESNVYNWGRKV